MEDAGSKTLELSTFDQTIVRVYVRKLFGFAFPHPSKMPEAVKSIQQALHATLERWPFIAGTVGPEDTCGTQNMLKLTYREAVPAELHPTSFVVKDLSLRECSWTYQELVEQGAPPSAMKKEVLSSLPEHPKPGEDCPAFGMQVNFLEGGLILCFAFHHTVFDGVSGKIFLRAFADNVKISTRRGAVPADLAAQQRLPCWTERLLPQLEGFPKYDFSDSPLPVASSAYNTSRIFTFTSERLAQLKLTVLGCLEEDTGNRADLSTTDCLCELIWVAVMRARSGRLPSDAKSSYAVAVNARHRLHPPLPEDYFGNAVLHTTARARVSELLTADAMLSVATIALAALRIRQAVNNVDDVYIRERLALFASLPSPTQVAVAFKRAVSMPNTGLDFSDWREQGADLEFRIPGTIGSTPDWVRKTWSANEGAVNIMPRRGGKGGPADWEVLLALNVEDMERVCLPNGLGSWMTRIV